MSLKYAYDPEEFYTGLKLAQPAREMRMIQSAMPGLAMSLILQQVVGESAGGGRSSAHAP